MLARLSLKWKLIFWLALIGFVTSFFIHLVLFLIGSSDISYTMRQYPIREWQSDIVEKPITQILGSQATLQSNTNELVEVEKHLNQLMHKNKHQIMHNKVLFTELTLKSFAIADINSLLINQSANSSFQDGDLGAQLPIQSRDDLSDALQGRNNSGIELLKDNNYLVVKPILNDQREILGALITTQHWQVLQDRAPLYYIPLFQAVLLALGYTLSSFLWIIPSTIVLGLLVARVVSKKLTHFNSTIAHWEKGDFLPQLDALGKDEIAQTFNRLNQMANKLAVLQQEQKEMAGIEERQQLAAELHDTVKQQLFATNLKLSTVEQLLADKSPQLTNILHQCIEQNQVAFAQINDLILSLNPIPVGEDLLKALDESIHQWQSKTGIKVDKKLELESDLSESKQLTIYRSIMEALQNVFKHSKADRVTIRLAEADNEIKWQVTNKTDQHESLQFGQGLNLMKKRIVAVNGNLDVKVEKIDGLDYFKLIASIPV